MTLEQQSSFIDWEHLHQISGGDKEFELELLQLFFEDAQGHLEGLRRAIATQNLNQLEQAAHHIKGASANVGLQHLAETAGQIEQQARQQVYGTETQILEIEQSLQQLHTYLQAP